MHWIYGQMFPIETASQMLIHANIAVIDLWAIGAKRSAGETNVVWKACGSMMRTQRQGSGATLATLNN